MRRTAIALMTMLPLLSAQSAPVDASLADDLKRMVRKLDRTMCRNVSSDKCKAPATTRKSAVKTIRKKQAEKQSPATAAEVAAPIEKPAAAAAKPSDSIEAPILPILKPRKLAQPEKPLADPVAVPSVAPQKNIAKPMKPTEVVIAMLPRATIPAFPPATPAPHTMPDDVVVGQACLSALGKIGANFVQPATPVSSGVCSVTDAVTLKSVAVGENLVTFPDQPTLTCGFALRFANWVKDEGDPIVQTWLNTHIKSIGTGPGYECRGRNGDASGKLSEHAFGNAADIERIK